MLRRLSWIHDVFDVTAVYRDRVILGAETGSWSWTIAVSSVPSPPLVSCQYILRLLALTIDIFGALDDGNGSVSRESHDE
jgi:hypothetical protein